MLEVRSKNSDVECASHEGNLKAKYSVTSKCTGCVVSYLCPADDFAVGFELRSVEDLDAGDGLHRLPIDGTDHTE